MWNVVRDFILQERLLSPGQRVVVAVSGGGDSMALLDVLCHLQAELELDLHVAHLDHALRPGSAEDAAFVAEQAQERGLACTADRVDVRALARASKQSLEAAARQARYGFLRRVARAHRAARVALGHTRSDQVETFFLHLVRGAGPAGLKGMLPRQGPFIRPLLRCPREAVRRYVAARALPHREDPTNRDERLRRNWVRHRLLPQLEEFNPNLIETLARSQEVFRQTADFMEQQARQALERLLVGRPGRELALERAGLLALHPALQAEVVRLGFQRLQGGRPGPPAERVRAVLRAARGRTSGLTVELPGRSAVFVEATVLRFARCSSRPQRAGWPAAELAVPGTTRWGPWQLSARLLPAPAERSNLTPQGRDRLAVRLDWGKIRPPLVVRARRAGDRLEPLGLGGHKKVQDVLVDARVPRARRDSIPVLQDARGVLWVVGHCLSERVRRRADTQATLEVLAARVAD